MKKYLSIKRITQSLSVPDREAFKKALSNDSERVDFLRIVGEILESTPKETFDEMSKLLDFMVYHLYQNSSVKEAILTRLEYAEKMFLHENKAAEIVA